MGEQRSSATKRGLGRKRRVPQLLADMRKVYRQPESADASEGMKSLRKLMKEKPEVFMNRLARLEEVNARMRMADKDKGGSSPDRPDEGERRVLLACDRLLDEWDKAAT